MEAEDFTGVVENTGHNRYAKGARRSFSGYNRGWYNLPGGERLIFVTLTSTGIKEQGKEFSGYFSSEEVALDALSRGIEDYIYTFPLDANLHWRRLPDAHSETFYREDFDSQQAAELSRSGRIVLAPKLLWVASCRLAVHPFDPLTPKGESNA